MPFKNKKINTLFYSFILLGAFFSSSLASNLEAAFTPNLLALKNSPSPYECAVLSFHVYQPHSQPNDSIHIVDEERQQEHALAGWTVHTVFAEASDGLLSKAFRQLGLPYGYQAALYMNSAKKQAVLAHRGTELKNMSAISTDISSIAGNTIGGQERSVPLLLDQALSIAQQHHCSLTITGHSLGGWLAQLTAFIARDRYPDIPVKAITFDSPGAHPMLTQINARINPIDLNLLDITNYLSSPNLINACNQHVGTVYRIIFNAFSTISGKYTAESHSMVNFLRAFDMHTGMATYQAFVEDWPLVSKESLKGGYKLLTSNKIKAVFYLFSFIKKCAQQEVLGEYSGFFKLANQTNQFHTDAFSLEGKDSFDINYKYHYKTKPYDPTLIHIRHIPQGVYYFLEGVYKGSTAHLAAIEEEPSVRAIKWDRKNQVLVAADQTNIQWVVDRLISLALQHKPLCETIDLVNGEGTHLKRNLLLPPPAISFFVGRTQELKILTETLSSEAPRIIAPPITGVGGIGKSQLALRVIAEQRRSGQYEYIFWISAASREKLLSAYVRLAEGLGIYIDPKNPAQAIQLVQQHLQNKHCLYIFEDAPDAKAIQDFLPLQRGHVLITSRNSNANAWLSQPLILKPFTKKEALALGKTLGYAQTSMEEQALKKLLTWLPLHPLGLMQLFSLLEDEGLKPAHFLKAMQAYDTNQQETELIKLLAEQPGTRTRYNKSLFYVFKKSLEQLQKEAGGEKALELLQQLAYLDPQGIPLDFLLTLDQDDVSPLKRSIRAALARLEQHSLLQWDRQAEKIYVHDFTQRIVRHLYAKSSFTALIHALVAYVQASTTTNPDPSKWYTLLVHGRVLFGKLDVKNYLQEAYMLSKYLVQACRVHSLFKEEDQWSQQNLAIASEQYANNHPMEYAHALYSRGMSLDNLGKYQDALAYYQQSLQIYKQTYSHQDHPAIAHTLNTIGTSLNRVGGQHQAALSHHQAALSMYQRIYGENTKDPVALQALALSFNNVGSSLGRLGLYEQEIAYKERALAMYRELYATNPNQVELGYCLETIGVSFNRLGKDKTALSYYQQALAIYEAVYEDHPKLVRVLSRIGRSLSNIGQYQEGLACCIRSLAIQKRLYGEEDHPATAQALSYVGYTLTNVGQYKEGVTSFEQGLAMQKRIHPGQVHHALAKSLYFLGYGLYYQGNYAASFEYFMQASTMYNQIYQSQDHFNVAKTLHYLGLALQALGRYEEALTYGTKTLAMRQKLYQAQPHNPLIAESFNSVGGMLADLKQYEAALASCQQALEIQQQIYQDQVHPDLVVTYLHMGEIFLARKQDRQSTHYYKQAFQMALQIYPLDHPLLERYVQRLVHLLQDAKRTSFNRKIKKEILPLLKQRGGSNHPLVMLLSRFS